MDVFRGQKDLYILLDLVGPAPYIDLLRSRVGLFRSALLPLNGFQQLLREIGCGLWGAPPKDIDPVCELALLIGSSCKVTDVALAGWTRPLGSSLGSLV